MIEIKLLPNSEVEIIGEIPARVFESFRKDAIKEISNETEIEGFRKGKAPEDVLIKEVGEEKILYRMALLVLKEEYPKIIKEHKIKAIGRPEITVTKIAPNNPLAFRARLYVLPEIVLPDYREIFKTAEHKEEDKRYIEILDKIIEKTEVEIPKILLEAEKIKFLEEMKNSLSHLGLEWNDYLKNINKSEEELLKEYENDAIKRIKYGLVLEEMAEREKIEVSDLELEEGVKKIVETYGKEKDLDMDQVRVYTYGIIRNKKLFDLLSKN